MAVTPEELLDAAAKLERGNSEADWRNAASRAYYAAYHRCRGMAQDERLSVPDGGSHHAALDLHVVDVTSIRETFFVITLKVALSPRSTAHHSQPLKVHVGRFKIRTVTACAGRNRYIGCRNGDASRTSTSRKFIGG